jgi:hypothetical protein
MPVICFASTLFLTGVRSPDGLLGQQDTSRETALERFTADLKYMASDELGGRLPGTPEMDQCVEFIIEDFKKSGIAPAMPDGTYLQTFDVGRRSTVEEEKTGLKLSGPDSKVLDLQLNQDFSVQLRTDSFDVNGELVFVGYGIQAEEHNFDEYRNLDCQGKIVVMLRMEPQQSNPESVFDGEANSAYAAIRAKVSSAVAAGAAGIILVNDGKTAPGDAEDELAPADLFGNATAAIPFAQMKRAKFNKLLAASPLFDSAGKKLANLADVEAFIDKALEPISQGITGWTANFKASFAREAIMTSNIIGVIEGDGPHADETIVIGAHYDHLGMGAFGSRSGGRREIHNGADDNATGTAAVMELVRRFQARGEKPGRRLVFICFTAEEMGLLGAQHYVSNPVFPLESTVAMINFDMIGWLRDDKLTVFSWETAPQFAGVLDRANETFKLDLVKPNGGFAGSDHLPFMQRQIPVMFLHTGLNSTYHTPEDDFETIDCAGAVKVVDFTERLIEELVALEERPQFSMGGPARNARVRLGAQLETAEGGGAKVISVTADSIAAKSGLQEGDVITQVGDKAVAERRDVVRELAANAGKKVVFKITREGKTEDIEVDLGSN